MTEDQYKNANRIIAERFELVHHQEKAEKALKILKEKVEVAEFNVVGAGEFEVDNLTAIDIVEKKLKEIVAKINQLDQEFKDL